MACGTALASIVCLSACEPEVGSARWCTMMEEKPRGDWTANQALDYGRYCLFVDREEK